MECGFVFYKPKAVVSSIRYPTQSEAISAACRCALAGSSGQKGKKAAHARFERMSDDQKAVVWALAEKAGFTVKFVAVP